MIQINHVLLPLKKPVTNEKNLQFYRGMLHCICGLSGSGKTTFLYQLGLLDNHLVMDYQFNDKQIVENESVMAQFRKYKIGYVFQDYNLIDHLTIKQNIELSSSLAGHLLEDSWLKTATETLGLKEVDTDRFPSSLSGGQKQRVAILCAIAKHPDLLILDEPTSALDENNAIELMTLLKRLAKEYQMMVVIATHSQLVREQADCIYEIKDGVIYATKEVIDFNEEKKEDTNSKSLFSAFQYAKLFFREHFKTKLFLAFMAAFVISLLSLTIYGSDTLIKDKQRLLNQTDNTEIKVASFLDISEEQIEEVRQIDGVKECYPLINLEAKVNQIEFDLVKTNQYIVKDNKNYISYELAQLFQIENYPCQFILDGYTITVDECLTSLDRNKYNSSLVFIYVGNEEEQIIFDNHLSNTILVYCDSFTKINAVTQVLEVKIEGSRIESEYNLLEVAFNAISTTRFYLILLSFCLGLIVFLMLLIISLREIANREYEFCLLKANGLTNKEVTAIILNDTFLLFSLVMAINLIAIVGFSVIYHAIFELSISIAGAIVLAMSMSFISLAVPSVIAVKKCLSYSPSQYLRT